MSRVRRLSIHGIRNFGPAQPNEESPTIRFTVPLTLILGPNGTGKTTIIEALKYATTGDFPPGSDKGKAFIHDPLLTDKPSVRGGVKAELLGGNGEKLIVSRLISSTQTLHTKKFQTIDSTITRFDKNGAEISVGTRCVDVDVEVGLFMGVSKAILNNVIFCHQEDANWPLEDSKKLKERFDQIFDSAKYNKALEKLRELMKKLQLELRGLQAEKNSLKVILEETREKQSKLETSERRLESSNEKIGGIVDQLQPLRDRLSQIQNIEARYIELNSEKVKKKTEYSLLKQQIEELKDNIHEVYEGSTEDLQNEITSYDSILTEKENQVKTLEARMRHINEEEVKLINIIGNQQREIGTYKQRVQDQEKRVAERNTTLNNMLVEWGMHEVAGLSVGSDTTEIEATGYVNQLVQKMHDMECSIVEMGEQHEITENIIQKELDGFRERKSKLESEMVMRKREIAEKIQEANRTRAQLEEVDTSARKLNIIESRLEKANNEVNELSASLDVDDLKDEINQEIKKRDGMETSLERIDHEVTMKQQYSSLQAELELHRTMLAAKERDIRKLKDKHEANLKMMLNVEVLPETDLKRAVDRVQDQLTDQIRILNMEIQDEQREITTLEITKRSQEQELQKKSADLETIKENISSLCHGKDYDELVLEVSKTIKDLQDSRGMYAYQGVAYKNYIKKLEEIEPCCPLCHRGFQSQEEIGELKTELVDGVNKYPHQLKVCDDKLKVQQRRYDALQQLQPDVMKVTMLEEVDLKKLKDNLQETKGKLSASRSKLEDLQLAVAEPESTLAMCKDIVGDVALWNQYVNEKTKLGHTIASVRSRVPDTVSDSTIQEVQAEQENLRLKLNSTRKRIETLQMKVNTHNEQLQRARESRNELFEEQLKILSGMQKVKQFHEKINELDSQGDQLKQNVLELQKQLSPIKEQLDATARLLEESKKKHRAMRENSRKSAADRSRKIIELKKLQTDIDAFIQRGIAETLMKAELDMVQHQNSSANLKKDKTDVSDKIQSIRNHVSQQQTRKRALHDNMSLRRKVSDAETFQHEIEELREKLGGMNYKKLMDERNRLREQEQHLFQQENMAKGRQAELKQNIAQLRQELGKDIYRLAQTNYIDKCTDVVVHEEAIRGVKAYSTALDKSMIAYHQERMATVNKIIRKLWDMIYKGTDTTAIQIKTDVTQGVGGNRRTYNYRLVQEKQKREMDMRGRCSAGQKVLASIIIRMALAETFCRNCGVLALDEPTTNLDETNTRSLAEALANIVYIRSKQQRNFQLIVITHDEKFMARMTRIEQVKNYWELYRHDSGLTGIRPWDVGSSGVNRTRGIKVEDGQDEDDREEDYTGSVRANRQGSSKATIKGKDRDRFEPPRKKQARH